MNELEILFELVKEENNNKDLKIFIKENIDFVIKNNLKEILQNKISDDSELWNIINSFYDLINKKINLIVLLKKWKEIYINEMFWNLSTTEQIDFLKNLRTLFLSIYDCSQGGYVYHIKLMQIFNSNNYNYHQIMEDVEDRLKRILTLFGSKIFEYLKIPLITVHDLYNFSHDQILKYFTTIFNNLNQLLQKIIILFESFNLNCNELDNLLNI